VVKGEKMKEIQFKSIGNRKFEIGNSLSINPVHPVKKNVGKPDKHGRTRDKLGGILDKLGGISDKLADAQNQTNPRFSQ
jgi:hypothetical protein